MYTILGVRIDDLTPDALRHTLLEWLQGDQARLIVTPNPEFILLAARDSEFKQILAKSDLSLPDGIGLKFAVAALTEARLTNRHTGADTLVLLAELACQEHKRLVLLGGSPRKTVRAAVALRERFPGLDVATFDPGIIDEQHVRLSEATLAGVERLSPQIIAVALGQGKQERVMTILKAKIPSVRILIGVGGASDYISKAVSRAPLAWQKYGFEWLWRLIQQPWRWQRILSAIIVFPLKVVWVTLVRRRFIQAVRNVGHELKQHFKDTL